MARKETMALGGAAVLTAVLSVCATTQDAAWAQSLNIEGLSKDGKAYRVQVEQIVSKVDGVIVKLKDHAGAQALVLDLEQTRDNIMREMPKMDAAPGDAKWGAQEMRDSVQAMLKLMKEQYDKASALTH